MSKRKKGVLSSAAAQRLGVDPQGVTYEEFNDEAHGRFANDIRATDGLRIGGGISIGNGGIKEAGDEYAVVWSSEGPIREVSPGERWPTLDAMPDEIDGLTAYRMDGGVAYCKPPGGAVVATSIWAGNLDLERGASDDA